MHISRRASRSHHRRPRCQLRLHEKSRTVGIDINTRALPSMSADLPWNHGLRRAGLSAKRDGLRRAALRTQRPDRMIRKRLPTPLFPLKVRQRRLARLVLGFPNLLHHLIDLIPTFSKLTVPMRFRCLDVRRKFDASIVKIVSDSENGHAPGRAF